MSLLSKLFGGGGAPKVEATEYQGFTITPNPSPEGGRFRIGAMIEKDGKTHTLIRADVLDDFESAVSASVGKARQVIDEQGERLFS